MTLAEVGIHGGSLGGLTSCYAASKYPDYFVRAICSSPTNCYNFGSGGLSSVIGSNYAATGKTPKAVIQFHGSEMLSGDGKVDGDEYQMNFLIQEDKAWQSIGLVPVTLSSVYSPATKDAYGFYRLNPLPDRIIMSIVQPAGQHAPATWEQEFAAALPIIYRANRADKLRIPKSEFLAYYSVSAPPSTSPSPSTSSTFELTSGEVAACVLVPTVITLATMLAYQHFILRPLLLGRALVNGEQKSPMQGI